MKKVERTAVRCLTQRPAWADAGRCDVLCSALLFQRHLFGRSAWQAREKSLSASCACFCFLGEIPQAQPSIPFNPFWWDSPGTLSSRFFLFGKAVQASSSSISILSEKVVRHLLRSFLPFEKSCQAPPRPPLSPLKKAGRAPGLSPFIPKSHHVHSSACSSPVGMKQDRAGHF